jgi:hypothetical protein
MREQWPPKENQTPDFLKIITEHAINKQIVQTATNAASKRRCHRGISRQKLAKRPSGDSAGCVENSVRICPDGF